MATRKSGLRMMSVLLAVVLVLAMAPSVNAADHGLVRENGVDLYRDNSDNLHTIVVIKGIQYVEFPMELIPLKDLQEADGGAGVSLPTAGRIGPMTAVSPVSYSQRYSGWSGTTLGSGPSTIGTSGCYLTSAAMMVATYGSQLQGATATPLSLNTWMKNNGGFNGDLLNFGALVNLPGGVVSSVSYFNDWYSAQLCMYNGLVPIIYVKTSSGNDHYCAFVQTTGTKSPDTDWIINPWVQDQSQMQGIRQTVTQANCTYQTSAVFRVGTRG